MAFSQLPKTFDEIKSYLIQKIVQKYPSLGAFLENSFLIIFLDIVAYVIEIFMRISEINVNENSLIYTTNYENARIKAAFYKYEAARQKSATGYIKIGMDSSFATLPTSNITFKKFDRITIAGINFLINADSTLSSNPLDNMYLSHPDEFYIDVPVIQGQFIELEKTAVGNQSEFFEINDENIENDNIYVYVNDVLWEKVDSFFESTEEDTHYVIESLPELGGIKIIFGDTFLGKSLATGDSVDIQYVKTTGLLGQIKSKNLPVTFIDSYEYPDSTEAEVYGISSTFMENASGYESIDSLKHYGQISASSMENKAFNDDELSLELREFGGILASKSFGEYDLRPTAPYFHQANIIDLLIIPEGGGVLGASAKSSIRRYLRSRTDWTDFFRFIDPEYIYVKFILDFEVSQNTPTNFAGDVSTFLQTTYSLQNAEFQKGIDHSDVIYLINKNFIDYVRRFHLYLRVIEDFSSTELSTYPTINKTLLIGNLRLNQINIPYCKLTFEYIDMSDEEKTETVEITENEIEFGGSSSLVLDTSVFNHVTGEMNLVFKDGHTIKSIESIRAEYSTNDIDGVDFNIDIKYNQVALYHSADIQTEVV